MKKSKFKNIYKILLSSLSLGAVATTATITTSCWWSNNSNTPDPNTWKNFKEGALAEVPNNIIKNSNLNWSTTGTNIITIIPKAVNEKTHTITLTLASTADKKEAIFSAFWDSNGYEIHVWTHSSPTDFNLWDHFKQLSTSEKPVQIAEQVIVDSSWKWNLDINNIYFATAPVADDKAKTVTAVIGDYAAKKKISVTIHYTFKNYNYDLWTLSSGAAQTDWAYKNTDEVSFRHQATTEDYRKIWEFKGIKGTTDLSKWGKLLHVIRKMTYSTEKHEANIRIAVFHSHLLASGEYDTFTAKYNKKAYVNNSSTESSWNGSETLGWYHNQEEMNKKWATFQNDAGKDTALNIIKHSPHPDWWTDLTKTNLSITTAIVADADRYNLKIVITSKSNNEKITYQQNIFTDTDGFVTTYSDSDWAYQYIQKV